MRVCVRMCVHMCACVCVYIHTHACIENKCQVNLGSAFISSPRPFEFHTSDQRPNLVAMICLASVILKKKVVLSAYL